MQGGISDRVIGSVVAYARGREGDAAVGELLRRGEHEAWLEEPTGRWVPAAVLQQVSTCLAAGDQAPAVLARQAGFQALRMPPMSGLAHLVQFLADPAAAYSQLEGLLPLFVRDAVVSVSVEGPRRATVRVDLPMLSEPAALVAFGAGVLEGLPTFWDRGAADVRFGAEPTADGRLVVDFDVSWAPGTPSARSASAGGDRSGPVGDGRGSSSWFQVDQHGVLAAVGGSAGAALGLVPTAVSSPLEAAAACWTSPPLVGLVAAAHAGRVDHATLQAADGQWLRVRVHPFDEAGDDRRAFLGSVADWSLAREHHRALVAASHLATLGRLAGGAAHAFSNALTGILGYAELGRQPDEPALAQRALRMIQDAATTARRAVDLMTSYADDDGAEIGEAPGPVDLSRVVTEVLHAATVDRRWESIELIGPMASLPPARGTRAAYRHILFGLLAGTLAAIDAGASVTVAAEALRGKVVVRIEVTGGSPWRDSGEVTLAAVHSLTQEVGGALNLQSDGPEHALAVLRCPIADAPVEAPAAAGERALEVLVVDDEAVIRTLLIDIVTHAGHVASGARHGGEAWKLLLQRHYDVVLCDVLMPVMNGLELFGRLDGLSPRPTLIAMTGKTTTEMEQAILRHNVAAILQKPFPMQAVTELLERFATTPAGAAT